MCDSTATRRDSTAAETRARGDDDDDDGERRGGGARERAWSDGVDARVARTVDGGARVVFVVERGEEVSRAVRLDRGVSRRGRRGNGGWEGRWDAMGCDGMDRAIGGGGRRRGRARGRAGWIRAFWFSKSERAAEGVSETAVEGNRRRETRDECMYD